MADPLVSNAVVSILVIVGKAVLEEAAGEATKEAYKALRARLVGWAGQAVKAFEAAPETPGSRDTLAMAVDRLDEADKKTLVALADRAKFSWIAELLAAAFVDEMRMFYVGAGERARRTNAHRYGEFRKMAEGHFADFDRQMARFSKELPENAIAQLRTLEPRLRAVLEQLAPAPCAPDRVEQLRGQLTEIARLLKTFCVDLAVGNFEEIRARVDQIAGAKWRSKPAVGQDTDAIFRLRLEIQTEYLSQAQIGNPEPIRTIATDYNQTFALAYYLIDLWLLEQTTP